MEYSSFIQQDQLQNVRGPMQNENVVPLLRNE